MTERHTRSHSQLSDYLHCGWAFRLKRFKKVQEAPSVWLPGGRAFHAATEAFDRYWWDVERNQGYGLTEGVGENDPAAEHEPWMNLFSDEFELQLNELRENDPDESKWRTAGRKTKEKPNGEDIAWWAEAGREFIGRYIDWRISTDDTLQLLAVEGEPGIEVEVTVPIGGVPMRGYIDRLFADRSTGEPMVVDLKTGSRTPVSPMQLALYSIQLEAVLKRPVVWGAYFDARKGVLTEPIDLSTFTEQKLGVVYNNLDKAVEAGIFLPRIDSHCKACGVRSACIFQGGIEPQ